jgi:hypothetical protein
MSILNQYSYVMIAIVGGFVLAAVIWRWKAAHPFLRIGLGVLFVAAAVGVGFALNYPASTPNTPADVEAVIDNSQPTIVLLYSDY